MFCDFSPRFNQIPYCGAPFPFRIQPVIFKEKFLLLPTFTCGRPIQAYHITDEKKAVEIPFECHPLFPFGHIFEIL